MELINSYEPLPEIAGAGEPIKKDELPIYEDAALRTNERLGQHYVEIRVRPQQTASFGRRLADDEAMVVITGRWLSEQPGLSPFWRYVESIKAENALRSPDTAES